MEPPRSSAEAVSPIVGVVLMVAITIVVAGVLFIIVQGIGIGGEPAPLVQFLRDNRDGQLKVVQMDDDQIDLTQVEVKISKDGWIAYNENAGTSTIEAPAGVFVPVSDTSGTFLKAGDYLEFCLDGPTDSIEVAVRITHPPDVIIYENSLTGLHSC
jgi:flagellin-like protein